VKHIISLIVENKPGVLARISGLFSARGYNISSLAVSETLDPTTSYMTMVVNAEDERVLEQIKKQLNKLIDVITVIDFTKKEHIDRELVLIKVTCQQKDLDKLKSILKKYSHYILKVLQDTVIIEMTGNQEEIKDFIEDMKTFGIKELVRTGRIAISQ